MNVKVNYVDFDTYLYSRVSRITDEDGVLRIEYTSSTGEERETLIASRQITHVEVRT